MNGELFIDAGWSLLRVLLGFFVATIDRRAPGRRDGMDI